MQSEAEGSPPAYLLELLSARSTPVVLTSVSPACEQATGKEMGRNSWSTPVVLTSVSPACEQATDKERGRNSWTIKKNQFLEEGRS